MPPLHDFLRRTFLTILLLSGPLWADPPRTDQPAVHPAKVKVFMVGDSTMADYHLNPAGPMRGWGQLMPLYFHSNVTIVNRAVSGHTSHASLAQRWPGVLAEMQPGDYVIIQFGHNDMKEGKPGYAAPFGAYTENLERFVRETRDKQGSPLLATSVARRAFDEENKARNTLGDYPQAVREVGARLEVPVLEMNLHSMELLTLLGPERSAKLFCNPEAGEYPDYKPPRAEGPGLANPAVDNTHFNAMGASRMADIAAQEIRLKAPDLARWLRD